MRAVPAPATTPFVRPGRHAAPETAPTDAAPDADAARDAPSASHAAGASLAPEPAPTRETPEAHAARRVRETWDEVEAHVDELADWFAALLFSLAPETRALFPTRVTEPARRLVRSLVLPMSTVDRPDELRRLVEPLVREHRALGLHAGQYEPLGVALVGAMRRYGGQAWDEATEHAWVRAFSLAAGPMEQAVRAAATPAVTAGTVVGHRRLSWDLAVVHVRPDVPVPHRAGQYLTVEVPQRPRMWRALSPATAPRPDGLLEFHVRAVEGGWVSRALVAHAATGDRWRLGPASGRLGLDPGSSREVLMVAGGTGGAPVLALCEDMARRPDPRPCTVFLGGRVPEDLTVLDRLRALAEEHSWLAVAAVCEDDPLDERTLPGTLPEAVLRGGDWSGHDVLLSGSPTMIRATASALLVDGVPLDHISYDPFAD
ncbi:FAD-binding oxidoreductase [Actinomycetospora cinnamomea]|uniref:FAD-binding oxidoreductase n=1 Tax=Actinomycetospora cinnamomea TaxID=663609 RepID=UPI001FAEB366|nr:FAD-binding oxidoreductase [Actinomycetospora cinnamomea]